MLNKVKIRQSNVDKYFEFGLSSNFSPSDRGSANFRIYSSETEGQINVTNDLEKALFKISSTTDIQFEFYDELDNLSSEYTALGYGENELTLKSFVNSFYFIELFDSYHMSKNTKLGTKYLYPSSETLSTTITLTKNSFLSGLNVPQYIIDNNDSEFSLYIKFNFFFSKTGKIKLFQKKNSTKLNELRYFYKINFDSSNYTYSFSEDSIQNVEMKNTLYEDKYNTLSSYGDKFQQKNTKYSSGTKFNVTGKYDS